MAFFIGVSPTKFGNFSIFSFQAKQDRVLRFKIFWKENKPFLDNKIKKLKKSRKIGILLKGIDHGFGQKLAIFLFFILRETGKKYVFYDILERNTPSQNIKTKSKKIPNNGIFPKGLVHGFDQKLAIFPTFYFRQNRTALCVLRYSRMKKRFYRL